MHFINVTFVLVHEEQRKEQHLCGCVTPKDGYINLLWLCLHASQAGTLSREEDVILS